MLEASAGTGKTFALAGLVTRYLAETETTLDEMLLITFNRAASRELRERVRDQIAEAVSVLDGRAGLGNDLVEHLVRGSDDQRTTGERGCATRWRTSTQPPSPPRMSSAGSVLKSLGVAGETATGVRVEGEPRRPGHRDRRRPLPGRLRTVKSTIRC